jgi:phosphodiesterase/alkaline phosphatase D-like protein
MQVVCGPIVRRTTANSSTIWVELNADSMVQVTAYPVIGPLPAGRTRGWKPPARNSVPQYTVKVRGRYYLLLPLEGLEPGWVYRYELQGIQTDNKREAWHREIARLRAGWHGGLLYIDIARSAISSSGPAFRTFPAPGASDFRIAFGSCRKADGGSNGPVAKGTDVLSLYGSQLAALPDRQTDWPHLLLLLGDQIYADDVDSNVALPRWKIKRRWLPPLDAPEAVMKRDRNKFPTYAGSRNFHCSEFEEFAMAYVNSWTSSNVAKLLGNLPTFMCFDDHEITDDWNITSSWVDQMMDSEWWKDTVADGLIAYWMYQGWGNPLPRDGIKDKRVEILAKAAAAGGDAFDELRAWFGRNLKPGSADYYYKIDTSPPVLVMDTRHDRTFAKRRSGEHRNENDEIIGENQWTWLKNNIERDGPVILAMGVPFLQFLCGDWMILRLARNPMFNDKDDMEAYFREIDVDWWTAFPNSFAKLAQAMIGRGPFIMLSGDVHYSYGMFGRYTLPKAHCGGHDPLILHAVSSPMRNQWPVDHKNDPEMCESIGVAGGSVKEITDQAKTAAKQLCRPTGTEISWVRAFFPEASDIFQDEKVAGKKSKWTRFNNIGVLKVAKDQKSAKVQWLGAPTPGASSLSELGSLDSGPGAFVR